MLEKGGLEPDRVAMGTQPPKPFEGGGALTPGDIFPVVTRQLKGVFAEPEGGRVEPEDGERNPRPGASYPTKFIRHVMTVSAFHE